MLTGAVPLLWKQGHMRDADGLVHEVRGGESIERVPGAVKPLDGTLSTPAGQ